VLPRSLLPAFVLITLSIEMCGPPKGSHDDEGGAHWAAVAQQPSTSQEEAARLSAAHSIKTVFVVALENKDWRNVEGSPSAPYINGTLLPLGAHAENYTTSLSPSEANYVFLEAGDRLGIYDNDDPTENYRTTKMHLSRQLETAGIRWTSYQESISGDACPVTSQGKYAAKHNPMVFFDDVTDGRNLASSYCIEHVRPYQELARDLAADDVARYNFITPNLCNDGHDVEGCASPDLIANADGWLSREVPKILESRAYREGGLLVIVWDEGTSEDSPPIGLIVLSPFAKPGYASTLPYGHASLLRTLQDIFAVRPYLRAAESAPPLDDLFAVYP
jgi:phosphatidylinositol-3-phosphatase